ncbi:uncharacterized protein LOC114255265 [Monomorium pharaonis]|uniref:uncharacterized protein LOC114255265 n=1 Tax=Monomorium pharaonis TaxID=307658 RepID=UPI00102E190A|nr:uncharacterized protein LOC114255265 [Monomorium pharaonis]
MSPAILILSALLLSSIPGGSTEDARGRHFTQKLQQNLIDWWDLYKTYEEEVSLAYCWTLHLLDTRPATNTSAPPHATVTGDCSNTVAEGTKCQQNSFPQNGTTGRVTPSEEIRKEERPQEKIQTRKKRTVNTTERAAPTIHAEFIENLRWPFSIVSRVLRDLKPALDDHQFSSLGTSLHAVNPTPNSKDDDKIDSISDFKEKISRLQISPEDVTVLRLFTGSRLRDWYFPYRRHSLSQKKVSNADEMASDVWMLREDHGTEENPAGRRAPLNNDGSSSTPSRSRRFQEEIKAERLSRMNVVKLMDSKENSSREPTINPKTSHRKPEELSPDSLLSPRERIVKRSLLESRGSEGEALERSELLQFKMVRGRGTKKPRSQRPREKESSRNGMDVSTVHPFFLTKLGILHQQMLLKNYEFSFDRSLPRRSKREDHPIRTESSALSLSNGQFTGTDSTKQLSQDSTIIALQALQNQDYSETKASKTQTLSPSADTPEILRRLVRVSRRIVDVMETHQGFICTRDYLWTKFKRWIKEIEI